MNSPPLEHQTLDELQRQTFQYFLHEVNPQNGLIADSTHKGSPASIAATGLALAAYPVGVERGFIAREDAANRTLTTLRFFRDSPQGSGPDATGYKGFYYHFLDMKSGRRAWRCELSTIDSALLLVGALTAATYFDSESAGESEIRATADALYRRADWNWAQNNGPTVTHGWKPRSGFIPYVWNGYCEALVLYVLGLGSPTFPLPTESYGAWSATYQWRSLFDFEFLYAGPLFIHQLSHLWIDFRGIQDEFMRGRGIDYFENSRRATYIQREYAIRNPRQFVGYSKNCWGITASNGPGPAVRTISKRRMRFWGYKSREVPDGPDDGTIAPWAVVASLPFAPEIVLPALQYFEDLKLRADNVYGFKATFNPTFKPRTASERFWISPDHLGLNQGPIVLMIENFRSGLPWRLMRRNAYIIKGLRRAGFSGGWLEGKSIR